VVRLIAPPKKSESEIWRPGFSGRMTGPVEESPSLDEITLSRMMLNVVGKGKFVGG